MAGGVAIVIIGGGQAWWFPIRSHDHVRVTEGVMSYEVDGGLRLADSIGTVAADGIVWPTEPETTTVDPPA